VAAERRYGDVRGRRRFELKHMSTCLTKR
jgi:hypothetical protein